MSHGHAIAPLPTAKALLRTYAALRPLVEDTGEDALAALAAAARTLASARFTTCFVALWNWSNAAVESGNGRLERIDGDI